MQNNWWIYLIIIVGVIAIYLLSALIIFLLMKGAKKKAIQELDKLVPHENERFQVIETIIKEMQNDGRYLPKNMLDSLHEIDSSFSKTPIDLSSIKNQNDFMILYLRKYFKEKRMLEKDQKYKNYDEKLSKMIFLNPSDKTSPYYLYNKKSSRYNAFLGMGAFNLFRGNNTAMPTL